MSTESSSSDSGSDISDYDESFFQEENCGYMFEPEYTEEELININRSVQPTSPPENSRDGTLEWCKCQKCVCLPTFDECLCCTEFSLMPNNVSKNSCLSDNGDFRNICLNRIVLETAYIAFLRYKGHRGRAPDMLTNRQYRLMAYRQFVCWVCCGHPLGKKNRVPLPACVVQTIRDSFPDEMGSYEGFHFCDNSDSDLD